MLVRLLYASRAVDTSSPAIDAILAQARAHNTACGRRSVMMFTYLEVLLYWGVSSSHPLYMITVIVPMCKHKYNPISLMLTVDMGLENYL